jgi:hypothetical protein
MSTYNQIAWLPLCAGLTGLGLVLSYMIGRKRGMRAMFRGAAWSLLPLAAYLTGAVEMIWRMGVAIGDFASSFVWSPRVWSGLGVTGLAAVLFLATGGRRRRRRGRVGAASGRSEAKPAAGTGAVPVAPGQPAHGQPAVGAGSNLPATRPEPAPVGRKAKRGKPAAGGDDDMKEIEDILRQRGIT